MESSLAYSVLHESLWFIFALADVTLWYWTLRLVQTGTIRNQTARFRMNSHSLALWHTNANCNLHCICLKHIPHRGSSRCCCRKIETSPLPHLPILRSHQEVPSLRFRRPMHLAWLELRFAVLFLPTSLFWILFNILILIQTSPANPAGQQQTLRSRSWAELSAHMQPMPLAGKCATRGGGPAN